jgi:Protein of unknown function (DUF2568)
VLRIEATPTLEPDMSALAATNLTLRFLLELGALGALGWWGARVGATVPAKLALATALPLAAAFVWGAFVAPNASVGVPGAIRLALQVGVFAAAALALIAVGRESLATGFAAVVVANVALMAALGQ